MTACAPHHATTKPAYRTLARVPTEILTIIDPSATNKYPSAMGSIIVGISVTVTCRLELAPRDSIC